MRGMNRFASSPAYLNGLPPTGQITVYVTGDNGTNQIGVPHKYEVLTTGQHAGTTNITVNSKTDAHSNAVVIDHQFKLMWSRDTSASVGPSSNGALPFTTTGSGSTAEGLLVYIAAANAANYAGYNDWRIPTDIELLSIRDMETPSGIPPAEFGATWAAIVVGTLTTRPNGITGYMTIGFTAGQCIPAAKTANSLVAMVRSM